MKAIKYFLSLVLFAALAGGLFVFILFFKPNTLHKQEMHLHIPTGSTFQDMIQLEEFQLIINKTQTFKWAAALKKFKNPKPGRYLIPKVLSNQELINLLRSGKQDPVQVSWSYMKSLAQLAGKVSQSIEADSISLYNQMHDLELMKSKGFNPETFILLFLPNTYEFYWNTSAHEFINRMEREYHTFWNDTRKEKAKNKGLNPIKVGILASIVMSETVKPDEMPIVAGLYLNRLKQGIKLQADPTVIFAMKKDQPDLQIRRVLTKDLSYDSPYNTYMYSGLPPGPILMPSHTALDAVLYAEKNNYIYMCADPNRPGYHKFTNDYNEHLRNGRLYHQWANSQNIRR